MIINMVGGGSGGLFLNSYATLTELQADSPKNNTLGFVSSVAVKRWEFGNDKPGSPEAGDCIVHTGKPRGTVDYEFCINIDKNGKTKIYPTFVEQFDGSSWVDGHLYLYVDGAWKDSRWYLVKNGIAIYEKYLTRYTDLYVEGSGFYCPRETHSSGSQSVGFYDINMQDYRSFGIHAKGRKAPYPQTLTIGYARKNDATSLSSNSDYIFEKVIADRYATECDVITTINHEAENDSRAYVGKGLYSVVIAAASGSGYSALITDVWLDP